MLRTWCTSEDSEGPERDDLPSLDRAVAEAHRLASRWALDSPGPSAPSSGGKARRSSGRPVLDRGGANERTAITCGMGALASAGLGLEASLSGARRGEIGSSQGVMSLDWLCWQ